jgi:hypothetical protein
MDQQPTHRTRSWTNTIKTERRQAFRTLRENPSLNSQLAGAITDAYGDAVLAASTETSLDVEAFPTSCPYTIEQICEAWQIFGGQ